MCSWYFLKYIPISIWFLHVEALIYFLLFFFALKTCYFLLLSTSQIPDEVSTLWVEGNFICSKWTISINSSFFHRMNSPFRAPWFIFPSSLHFNCLKNSACYYPKMILGFQIADPNKMGFLHLLHYHIIPNEIRLNQSNSWMIDLY